MRKSFVLLELFQELGKIFGSVKRYWWEPQSIDWYLAICIWKS